MYIIADVPSNVSQELDKIIYDKDLDSMHKDLAGNIAGEYSIPKGKKIVSPFLLECILQHKEKYPHVFIKAHSMIGFKPAQLDLYNLWVNFQKKYEFNPVHVHDGLYSFVIWHKIPFKIEDEKARLSKMDDKEKKAGHFSFLFSGHDGRVLTEDLPVDNKYEGKMALFPASLNHQVYPFYTSDEYRITISGNIGFAV